MEAFGRVRRRRPLIMLWAFVRLPALAFALYLLRSPIVTVIETHFDILAVTRFVIDVLSTPLIRLICAAAFAAAFLVVIAVAKSFRPLTAYLIVLSAAAAIVGIPLMAGTLSLRRSIVVWLLVGVNLAPNGFLTFAKRFPRAWNAFMVAGVGIAELFFAREYWQWLRSRAAGGRPRPGGVAHWAVAIPGVLLASLAFGILIRSNELLVLEQRIRLSGDAVVLERGQSFNWLQLDPTGTYLFVTGHTLPYLRRYDLRNLREPPLLSRISTGGAQGFAYDPGANEIYALNTYTNKLVYFDATTLLERRVIDVPGLSPGDSWLAVDPATDTLTIVSEADVRVGMPLLVLERSTGRILDQAQLDAGNVLKHPSQPWLYLSFFRRRNEVLLYNLQVRAITHRVAADPQAERMVYWKQRNELLVTSPLESRIMRFDADRLNPKGYLPVSFGVRAIAVDEARQLLLCGNLATGYVEIIDLSTGSLLNKQYLGPWLRTIQLQVETGTAYVSSNGALYLLNYTSPLRQARASAAPDVRSWVVSRRATALSPPG